MITSSDAYTSSTNGTLPGVNAINLVMDQDTVPDGISSRAMCPWTGTQSPNFVMNYYNAPLAYGVILAIEAGTPYVFADLQAQAGTWLDFVGTSTAMPMVVCRTGMKMKLLLEFTSIIRR